MADDAGALLVRSGLVSASALDEARARAVDLGGTLGEQLVAGGLVADEALTDFYKSRLLVPQVNPNTLARLPAKVVAVIPSDMAIELRAIPVSLDKDNNLTVAMGDPSDRHAVDEIAFFTSAYVVRACATQMQIAWCLAHYYGHVTPLGERLLQPTGGTSSPRALAAAVRPGPRARGHTGRIEAMRHRALVPGEAPKPAEPAEREPVEPVEPVAAPEPAAADAAKPTPPDPQPAVEAVPEAVPVQRARSVSGEIRVPKLRAASIKPPLPADEEPTDASGPIISIEAGEASGRTAVPDGEEPTLTSGPIISIEVDDTEGGGPSEEPTDRSRPAPPRRTRPAEPDPPELAARAGEVQLKTGPHPTVAVEEPRVVIAGELDEPAVVATSRTTTARMVQRPPTDDEAEPDLPAVAGELVVRTSLRATDRPITPTITVEITDEPSAPVVIHEQIGDRSEPVLLEQRRTLVDTPAQPDPEDEAAVAEEVLELPPKRLGTARPRGDRRTQLGIGVIAAVTRDGAVASELDDQPTGARAAAPPDDDPTKLDTPIAPEGDYSSSDDLLAAPPSPVSDDDTSPVTIPPPLPIRSPVPPPSGKVSLDNVRARAASDDDDDDDGVPAGPATTVMPAIDPLDDGWGPPGTTIPPPLLGAMPGAIEPESGVIPISNVDSAPLLMISPPLAPEVSRPDISQGTLARALQDATVYVLDLIRDLEHAEDRDEVVALMIHHLARTHRRTGFFAVRAGELSLFAVNPRPAAVSHATLRLDRPSTLQDIVGTRLPYRGPMHDDASRTFLAAVLGVSPPEILLVPVTVRERVVGILFGEHRTAHSFEDQLALAARAAGSALERILKARRG